MIGPLPECPSMHLNRGYDSGKTRDLLEIFGYDAHIIAVAVGGGPARYRTRQRAPVISSCLRNHTSPRIASRRQLKVRVRRPVAAPPALGA